MTSSKLASNSFREKNASHRYSEGRKVRETRVEACYIEVPKRLNIGDGLVGLYITIGYQMMMRKTEAHLAI